MNVIVSACIIAFYVTYFDFYRREIEKADFGRRWMYRAIWFALIPVAIAVNEPWLLALYIIPLFREVFSRLTVVEVERRPPDIDMKFVKERVERWLHGGDVG